MELAVPGMHDVLMSDSRFAIAVDFLAVGICSRDECCYRVTSNENKNVMAISRDSSSSQTIRMPC